MGTNSVNDGTSGPAYVAPTVTSDPSGAYVWSYPDGSIVTASLNVTIEHNDQKMVDHISGLGTVRYQLGNGTTATAVTDSTGTTSSVANTNGHTTTIARPTSGVITLRLDGAQIVNPTAAQTIVVAARSYLGTSYAWGGGSTFGPTKGEDDNGDGATQNGDYNKVGFDCEGLVRYAVFQGTGNDIGPGSFNQVNSPFGQPVALKGSDGLAAALAGDLLFFTDPAPGARPHHVGVYSGNGLILEAPESGKFVQEVPVSTHNDLSAIRRFH